MKLKLKAFNGIVSAVFNVRTHDLRVARERFIEKHGRAAWRHIRNSTTTGVMEIFHHPASALRRSYVRILALQSDSNAYRRGVRPSKEGA